MKLYRVSYWITHKEHRANVRAYEAEEKAETYKLSRPSRFVKKKAIGVVDCIVNNSVGLGINYASWVTSVDDVNAMVTEMRVHALEMLEKWKSDLELLCKSAETETKVAIMDGGEG